VCAVTTFQKQWPNLGARSNLTDDRLELSPGIHHSPEGPRCDLHRTTTRQRHGRHGTRTALARDLGIGAADKRWRVVLVVAGLDIRVLSLDTDRDYRPL
jgi:hypothetical protein